MSGREQNALSGILPGTADVGLPECGRLRLLPISTSQNSQNTETNHFSNGTAYNVTRSRFITSTSTFYLSRDGASLSVSPTKQVPGKRLSQTVACMQFFILGPAKKRNCGLFSDTLLYRNRWSGLIRQIYQLTPVDTLFIEKLRRTQRQREWATGHIYSSWCVCITPFTHEPASRQRHINTPTSTVDDGDRHEPQKYCTVQCTFAQTCTAKHQNHHTKTFHFARSFVIIKPTTPKKQNNISCSQFPKSEQTKQKNKATKAQEHILYKNKSLFFYIKQKNNQKWFQQRIEAGCTLPCQCTSWCLQEQHFGHTVEMKIWIIRGRVIR